MMNAKTFLIALLFVAMTGGCGSGGGDQAESRSDEEKQQALRDSAFGDMAETLERAEDVDQLQKDRMSELNSAIEN